MGAQLTSVLARTSRADQDALPKKESQDYGSAAPLVEVRMRLVTASAFLLFSTAAYAASVDTPAGKIDLPPQPSRQYVHPSNKPPADPDVSWGKAGVSYSDYRQDALYCASYGVVYAINAPVWALSRTGNLWDAVNMHYPNADFRQLGQKDIERCLGQRGYSKFRLTPAEAAQLETLKPGSDERRHYLYTLASDASVLNSQKI